MLSFKAGARERRDIKKEKNKSHSVVCNTYRSPI
jgi:hypothetical protein